MSARWSWACCNRASVWRRQIEEEVGRRGWQRRRTGRRRGHGSPQPDFELLASPSPTDATHALPHGSRSSACRQRAPQLTMPQVKCSSRQNSACERNRTPRLCSARLGSWDALGNGGAHMHTTCLPAGFPAHSERMESTFVRGRLPADQITGPVRHSRYGPSRPAPQTAPRPAQGRRLSARPPACLHLAAAGHATHLQHPPARDVARAQAAAAAPRLQRQCMLRGGAALRGQPPHRQRKS